VPLHDGATLFKPAHIAPASDHAPETLLGGEALGLKVVSVRPRNAAAALATVPAVILLISPETGHSLRSITINYSWRACISLSGRYVFLNTYQYDHITMSTEPTGFPICMLEATALTAARTAAGSAIATTLMASTSAGRLVVFGAGLQVGGIRIADHLQAENVF
jgi:ornithine cyclodeaminase/alanine dehydrogenase-like protein (mu-crystallin family)